MIKSKKRLSEYWDNLVLGKIPPYARFSHFEREIKEHFSFLSVMFKRIIIPIILLYIFTGFFLKIDIFGSLFLSMLIFIYSNFLPDVDFIVSFTKNNKNESLWYEKYFLLCFAPIVIYYVFVGKAKPIYSAKPRIFHSTSALLVYGIFLLVVGSVFWSSNFKTVMFSLFGVAGFAIHLIVDGVIRFEKKYFKIWLFH